jgi:hypothetical protein
VHMYICIYIYIYIHTLCAKQSRYIVIKLSISDAHAIFISASVHLPQILRQTKDKSESESSPTANVRQTNHESESESSYAANFAADQE